MIESRTIVYRANASDPFTILERGGFHPRLETNERFSYNLTRHFEGEALEGETSGFVSTSYSLRSTILHAASLARPNSEMPFDDDFTYYIYMIRPADNFYDLESSLIHFCESLPGGSEWQDRCRRVLRDYGGMHELVALHGFSADRIMSYAVLDSEMLNENGISDNSPLFTDEYWHERWTSAGMRYNTAYDSDSSNIQPYPMTTAPTGRLAIFSRSNSDERLRLSSLFMPEMDIDKPVDVSNLFTAQTNSYEQVDPSSLSTTDIDSLRYRKELRRKKRSYRKSINWMLDNSALFETNVIRYDSAYSSMQVSTPCTH